MFRGKIATFVAKNFIALWLGLFLIPVSFAQAQGPIISFGTDRTDIQAGQCVTVHWYVEYVKEVYYNDNPVVGPYQSRIECPDEDTTYTLKVILRNNTQTLRRVHVNVSGSSFDDTDMFNNEIIDFDDDDVSLYEDDFLWQWRGSESGQLWKVDDDSDLALYRLGQGGRGEFMRLTEADCRSELDDHDDERVRLSEDTVVCFRTDKGDYGKFWVEDIRSSDGRLEIDWYLWD